MNKYITYLVALMVVCMLRNLSIASEIDTDFYYKKGSIELDEERINIVKRLTTELIKRGGNMYIRIVGHANYDQNNIDGRENSNMMNLELGIKRAILIAKVMVDMGYEEKYISVVSMGSSCPNKYQGKFNKNPNGRVDMFIGSKQIEYPRKQ